MGQSDFIVYDREINSEFRISYKTSFNDYEQSIYNGSAERFFNEEISSLLILHAGIDPVDNELIEAFREYEKAILDEFLKHCKIELEKNPDCEITKDVYGKYGESSPVVYGGYYDFEKAKWIRVNNNL